jgi:hypothetical protein
MNGEEPDWLDENEGSPSFSLAGFEVGVPGGGTVMSNACEAWMTWIGAVEVIIGSMRYACYWTKATAQGSEL